MLHCNMTFEDMVSADVCTPDAFRYPLF